MEQEIIVLAPTQKIVRIERCPKGEVYSYINNIAEEKAARELKAGAFKLWCYLRRNRDNFILALSPQDCKDRYGIGVKQYRAAVNELIKVGYLVHDRGAAYVFKEKGSSICNTR